MKEFQGTKGEWKTLTLHPSKIVTKSLKSNCNLLIADASKCYIGVPKAEQIANARLMATSPKLLKACIEMTEYCNKNNVCELVPEYEAMCDAINKALGEPNE